MENKKLIELGSEYRRNNNYDKMIECYKNAAEQGSVKAQLILGELYSDVEFEYYNENESFNWYYLAAKQGDLSAQYRLGYCYEYGFGVEQSDEQAYFWLKSAASKGYEFAKRELEDNIFFQEFKLKDEVDSKIPLAEQGDVDAQIFIAEFYFGKDNDEAIKWFNLAAEQGDARAYSYLGLAYLHGNGVDKKLEKAHEYLKLASEKGDILATIFLAITYENGLGTEVNYGKAFETYTKNAKLGDSISKLGVADCYFYGRGVEQSYDEAFKIYQELSLDYNNDAKVRLGICYEEGKGVAKSLSKAIELYRDAGSESLVNEYFESGEEEKGMISGCDSTALLRLGYCYYYGKGVDLDYVKAKRCFKVAQLVGYNVDYSYLIEMCNRELGIEDNNNYAREFIKNLNDDNYCDNISKKIEDLFNSCNRNIESKSKVFIKTGLITYYLFNKLQNNKDVVLDYTSCITPLLKALENEIKKYFIDGYMRYLETNVDIDKCSNNYFINKSKKEYYDVEDRFNKFTLGDFKDVLGLRENMNVISLGRDKSFDSNKNNTNRATVIDSTMLKYLKEEVFGKDKFSFNMDGEIINYLENLNEVIEFLTKTLRNPAAHDLVMTREKAETTINYLLFTKQLLVKFYEKMK